MHPIYVSLSQSWCLSSPIRSGALTNASRVFSPSSAAGLGTRDGGSAGVKASFKAEEILNSWPEAEVGRILRDCGAERRLRHIARKLVQERLSGVIHTTSGRVDVVGRSSFTRSGKKGRLKPGMHLATRSFQGLRLAVNNELKSVEVALSDASSCLSPGGRRQVISFLSLDDRIVKQFLLCRRGGCHSQGGVQLLTRRMNLGCLLSLEAKGSNWGNKNHYNRCWRLKRSCSSGRSTVLLSQMIRGTARDVGYSGLLLEPLSYGSGHSAPAVERNNRAWSPAGVDEEEKFLNALVASARTRETSRRNGCTGEGMARRKEEECVEDEVNEFQRGIAEGDHERIGTGNRNHGKQAWRLYVEDLQSADEEQVPSLESVSGNVRELEATVLYLESIGVDATKLLVYPFIVNCSLEKSKAIIRTLQSAGLKVADLGRILTMSPQIFGLSVENDLRPKMKFLLKEVGLRNQDLRKVIRRCPRLLVVSIEDQLRPTMQFLRNIGFTGMGSVVSNNPTLLTFSAKNKLIPKLTFLQSLGMSFEDACTMVVRFPAIFNYGIEQNLRPKYDFLVRVMGRDLDDLKAFPQYFGYSLDHRIRPRHEFFAQRNTRISLPNLLKLSDEQFVLRFKDVQVKAGRKLNLTLATDADSQVAAADRSPIPVPSFLPCIDFFVA